MLSQLLTEGTVHFSCNLLLETIKLILDLLEVFEPIRDAFVPCFIVLDQFSEFVLSLSESQLVFLELLSFSVEHLIGLA